MLAIYDFTPSYCPNCGKKTGLKRLDPDGTFPITADYKAGASFGCSCGLLYQKADREDILSAADAYKTGDLRQYA